MLCREKVSTSITPASAWLSIAVKGTGGNKQTVAATVDPSKLPDAINSATVTVSGGKATNTVSFNIAANKAGILAAPSQLIAQPAGDSLLDAQLSWKDNSADESGFVIERKKGETGSWEKIKQVAANATSYNDMHLDYGTYNYRVKAIGTGTESQYCNTATVQIVGTYWIQVISPPKDAVYRPGMDVAITWTCNRVDQVFIQYSIDEGLSWTTITQTGGITQGNAAWQNFSWSIPDMEADKVLVKVSEYDLLAEGISGAFTISKTAMAIKTKPDTRHNDLLRISSRSGMLAATVAHSGQISLRVFDIQGRCLFRHSSIGYPGQIIALPDLPPGIYSLYYKRANAKTAGRDKILIRY